MDILLFTLNGIIVYLVSDWIVRLIERRRGKVLEQRQVVFFVVFLVLILASFQLLKAVRATQSPVSASRIGSDAEFAVQARVERREVPGKPVAEAAGQIAPG